MYANSALLLKNYRQPEQQLFSQQVNDLMRTLFPEQANNLWVGTTKESETDQIFYGDATAKRETRGIRLSNNLQTVANTVDRHCHKAAPMDYTYVQQLNLPKGPAVDCYTPQNVKPKQPRLFGRDVFSYRNHITGNPQST